MDGFGSSPCGSRGSSAIEQRETGDDELLASNASRFELAGAAVASPEPMSSREDREDGNATTSIWQVTSDLPAYASPVPADHTTDVCIVGAGIAGLSVAYALSRTGTAVTIVDDGPVGGGETGRTSAHLSCALDDRFHHLAKLFGDEGARTAAESHRTAISWIESIVGELGIACDFRRVDGYLFAQPEGQAELDRELVAATSAGLDVAFVPRAPLPFDTGRCLRFAAQAEFHPLTYLHGLAAAVVAAGGRIHTGVHVNAVEGGAAPRVQLASGGVIHAKAIVDASNASITSRYNLPLRQAAYRSYLVGFDVATDAVPHGLYWDTEDPYHYIRVTAGRDRREVLLVGGADHRTGHDAPTGRWDELEAWTRERFPAAGAVVTRWSGQIMEPADALGYIGALPGLANVFVVSGDSGNGLTNGTIAGLLLPALIRGERHPWAELYTPARSPHHGLGTLLHEATSSTVPYTDWLRPAQASSLAQVPLGEGRVLRHGVHRIAVYRDETGACHLRSARCPHLGAVVRWNPLERSWDCPAHGSRFAARGRVVNSPSAQDLPALEPGVEAAVRETALTRRTIGARVSPRVAQGAYYVATGLWPVLHPRSFAAATGTRTSVAARLVGGAVAAVGAALLTGGGTGAVRGIRALGIASAVALGGAAAYLATRGRGRRINLGDAVIQAGFIATWLARRQSPAMSPPARSI